MDAVTAALTVFLLAAATVSASTLVWSTSAILRTLSRRRTTGAPPVRRYHPDDVAVVIAAHNEALVIADTIRSAIAQVSARNVFVVSDGSSDDTFAIAEAAGVNVADLHPNRGKAGAIVAVLKCYEIPRRFALVLFLDADTQLRPDYLVGALTQFDDPGVAAVAGTATTSSRSVPTSRMGRFLTAYRERVYVCMQFLHKYGQAAPRADAVVIVPGFASIYRSDVLSRISIDAPGLAIEDYNMTFEVHGKGLGRIAFDPRLAIAETQDPVRLGEYARQVRRWCLGLWQTVARHGVRPDVFGFTVGVGIVEVVTGSLILVIALPVLLVTSAAWIVTAADVGDGPGAFAHDLVAAIPPQLIVAGVLLPDLALTIVAAVLSRRIPSPWALLFPLMRVLDAALCLLSLLDAARARSDGRWVGPSRRSLTQDAHAVASREPSSRPGAHQSDQSRT